MFLVMQADRQYLLFSDLPNNRIWKWEVGQFFLGANRATRTPRSLVID